MKRSVKMGVGMASLLALPLASYKLSSLNGLTQMRTAQAAYSVNVKSQSRTLGGREVGEVLVNDRAVFRIRTGAGGYSAPQRAEVVAERLADMVNSGRLSPNDITQGIVNGQRVLTANGELLITADTFHAQVNGTSPVQLASMWEKNIVTALTDPAMAGAPRVGRRVDAGGGSAGSGVTYRGRDRSGAASIEDVSPDLRTKLVPILSAGTGVRLGMAQVTGPERDVDDVKAVAELETEWKRSARARVYVPISNLNVTQGIRRVPRVGVSGLADVRLRF